MKIAKETIRYDLIGKYKFKSTFVKTLCFLLMYSAILLLILFSYNNYITRKNVEQRLEIRTLGVLEKTQEGIDRELQNLRNQLEQLSRDEYIRAAMTAPNINNAERNYDIVYQLQTVSLVNDLVREAYLYITTDDTFFTTESAAKADLYDENSVEKKVIEFCQKMQKETGVQQLAKIEGKQYLFLSIPVFYDRVLGVLAAEIDSAYLSNLASIDDKDEAGNIFVYDEEGKPVFSQFIAYPKEITTEILSGMEDSGNGYKILNNSYYKVVSEQNGWEYLVRTDADLFRLEKAGTDIGFVLILLGLILFCIIFSIYLSQSVYIPIHKLIGIVENELNEGAEAIDIEESQNELELLEVGLNNTVMHNREMKHFLQKVKPTMLSDMFRNLLMGHEIEKEKLESMLSVLKSDFNTEQNYTLSIFSLLSEDRNFAVLECNILLHQIEQEIIKISNGKFLSSFVYLLENSSMVLVMAVPKEVSVKQVMFWNTKIEEEIKKLCSNYPVQCLIGRAKYLVDIAELYKLFVVVSKELGYRKYFDGCEIREQSGRLEEDKQMAVQMFVKLKNKIDSGEEDKVQQMVKEQLDLLIQKKNSLSENKEVAAVWWEAAMEVLLPLGIFEKEELDREKEQIYACLEEKEKFRLSLECFTENMIDAMKMNSKKLKRRYVERARQYVEEHYVDADLSLSSISEFLGISQSYMSTQFKREMGINFIEYLNRYRVEKSKLLLQVTEMTVEEVGFKTGFSSAKNFARVFKKYTEMSPGAFRDNK